MRMLQVVSPYRSQVVTYAVGAILDLAPEEEAFLLRDSPGSFMRLEKDPPEVSTLSTSPPEPPETDEGSATDGVMTTENMPGLAPRRGGGAGGGGRGGQGRLRTEQN